LAYTVISYKGFCAALTSADTVQQIRQYKFHAMPIGMISLLTKIAAGMNALAIHNKLTGGSTNDKIKTVLRHAYIRSVNHISRSRPANSIRLQHQSKASYCMTNASIHVVYSWLSSDVE
jgi:hypothetical protein